MHDTTNDDVISLQLAYNIFIMNESVSKHEKYITNVTLIKV